MRIEDQLRDIIKQKYSSIRQFTIAINEPYSTIDSILKRGVMTASISTMLKICEHLNIDLDALQQGVIKPRTPSSFSASDLTCEDLKIIAAYHSKPEIQRAVKILLGIDEEDSNK